MAVEVAAGLGGAGESVRSLENTPTWAVATVCTCFVIISFGAERSIYGLSRYLQKTKRKSLHLALEKMKDELMLVGFISLVITVLRTPVSQICIKSSLYNKFLPCSTVDHQAAQQMQAPGVGAAAGPPPQLRRLLSAAISEGLHGRMLLSLNNAAATTTTESQGNCPEGEEPFVTVDSLDQLHIFIFVMAVVHVVYSCLTMLLAMVKVYSWRVWEAEVHLENHAALKEITRNLTLQRQSTFAQYRTTKAWSMKKVSVLMICFFRQFGQSVTRVDYLTLREGFVTTHNLGINYDFHSYMMRCMEDEFKDIVGLSAPLWGFVILFLILNVEGSTVYFFLTFLPIILVLLVGAKLQHVIATLTLENTGEGPYAGSKLRPRDELFWFNRPQLVLYLIHFILFQNAFELATFIWFWWQFSLKSCLLRHHAQVYVRLALGITVQIFCSFSTLPLYTLVTQMGTNFKASVFHPHVKNALHTWHKGAKKRGELGISMEGPVNRQKSEDNGTHGGGSSQDGAENQEITLL
ncbi:hypothetical protein BDL97_12G026900 [Sphagnum fallax]|nr:hypothetical protein BDL97_12G026900 [Sphagnum fallax]